MVQCRREEPLRAATTKKGDVSYENCRVGRVRREPRRSELGGAGGAGGADGLRPRRRRRGGGDHRAHRGGRGGRYQQDPHLPARHRRMPRHAVHRAAGHRLQRGGRGLRRGAGHPRLQRPRLRHRLRQPVLHRPAAGDLPPHRPPRRLRPRRPVGGVRGLVLLGLPPHRAGGEDHGRHRLRPHRPGRGPGGQGPGHAGAGLRPPPLPGRARDRGVRGFGHTTGPVRRRHPAT